MSNYSAVAKKKCEKTVGTMFADAILAGMMIALGGFGSQMATALGMSKVVSAAVFPIGLVMVVLTGSELFTGNCLMAGALRTKTISGAEMLKNWGVVYIGNLVGAVLVALGTAVIGVSDALREVMVTAAETKIEMSAGALLVRAILCNILVCIAVWMAVNATDTIGKVFAAALPVFLFVLCGFEHSIANLFFLPAAALQTHLAIGGIVRQIILVTIGNIIGGALMGLALEKQK